MAGSVSIAESKQELVWQVTKAFTSKDQELSLEATVVFDTTKPSRTDSEYGCSKLNSFAQAFFDIQQRLLSEVSLDTPSLKVRQPDSFALPTLVLTKDADLDGPSS